MLAVRLVSGAEMMDRPRQHLRAIVFIQANHFFGIMGLESVLIMRVALNWSSSSSFQVDGLPMMALVGGFVSSCVFLGAVRFALIPPRRRFAQRMFALDDGNVLQ